MVMVLDVLPVLGDFSDRRIAWVQLKQLTQFTRRQIIRQRLAAAEQYDAARRDP